MSMAFPPGQPPDSIQIPGSSDGSGIPGAAPDASGGAEGDPIQFLKDAIDSLTQYQQVEPDAVDKATAAKMLAQLHSLLAKDQQDGDSQLTGKLNPRMLRKAGVIGS